MSTERYVGERRALWHFLSELQPLVTASLGENALLRYRIDQSLKAGDLDSLRRARRMFHHLPDETKRVLMRGIFEGKTTPATVQPSDPTPALMPGKAKSTGAIRFSAFPAACEEDIALSVELENERTDDDAPVQVMIEPGTLPRSVAETLRQIANWIEHDRRLLSAQNWVQGNKRTKHSDETLDLA